MIQTVPLNRLTLSPTNVRKTGAEDDIPGLAADIAAHGLIQNLLVIPARKKGHFTVIAGGRRLRACQTLAAQGLWPKDASVPVRVLDDGIDPAEASLAENIQRQAMNPADEARAFALLAENGATPADIAKRFGITERRVKQRLRLGAVAACVLDALRAGEISLDIALAFTATSDTQAQAALYDRSAASPYLMTHSAIRRALTATTLAAHDRLALYVGREAYIAAGGRIEEDLFAAADGEEQWLDRALAEQLAQARLEADAQSAAAAHGLAWVKPILAPRMTWEDTHSLREVIGTPVEPSPEELVRQTALEDELMALEHKQDATGALDDEDSLRFQALSDELDTLDARATRATRLNDAQKATAGTFLMIDASGQAQLATRYYADPAVPDQTDASSATPSCATSPNVALSARLADELAHHRADVLRVGLARDSQMAFDLLAFLLAEQSMARSGQDSGSALRIDRMRTTRLHDLPPSQARETLAALHARLPDTWTSGSIETRFDAFRALDPADKAAWMAWGMAASIEPSLNVAAGTHSARPNALHDHLAHLMGITVAAEWRPTAANTFDRLPKARLLAILMEIGGPSLSATYAPSKKPDLAAALEKLCSGRAIVDAGVRAAALAWVPDVMRFDATAHSGPAVVGLGDVPVSSADSVAA